MYKCSKCLTCFLFPIPSESFLTEFYAKFHNNYETGGGYELFEVASSRTTLKKIELIKRHVCANPEKIKLLDVGCGKGYFVKACIEAGIDAQGIDLSTTAINIAREMGLPCQVGKIEDIASELPQFDVVTNWATIEHVPDPLSTVKAMASLLKPKGSLFLDTGIGSDWLDNLLPGVVQWYDPPQHIFVFSKKGIAITLKKAGLTVLRIDSNFERSHVRRFLRIARGLVFGIITRVASCLGMVKQRPTLCTKFAIGNIMYVHAIKE
jgi:SAM-dependent methyltransferase